MRGVCGLRPGVPGVSENIRVRSIVGRLLEHTRVFHFENGGDPKTYCASADWMNRNLFQRVETCFPIVDKALRKRVMEEGLKPYLRDNAQAWEMRADGSYERVQRGSAEPLRAQSELLALHTDNSARKVIPWKRGKGRKHGGKN